MSPIMPGDAVPGDDGGRENVVCGSRRRSSATPLQRHGGQAGSQSFSFHNRKTEERTDTMIDTIMDHDTQLQGGFSVGQPVWDAGMGHDGVGY